MNQLQREIEKLAHLGEDKMITSDLVENLVAKTLEGHDAFKMLNAYLAHNV